MNALWDALSLVLVIEGALYALFPEGMKRAVLLLVAQPERTLRAAGVGMACVGVLCAWAVRHA